MGTMPCVIGSFDPDLYLATAIRTQSPGRHVAMKPSSLPEVSIVVPVCRGATTMAVVARGRGCLIEFKDVPAEYCLL